MMRIALIVTAAFVTACQTVPSREFIGSIEVDGPNAYLNAQPARNGQRVYDGDTVATGPQTGLKVRLATGGYLLLDENTDPRLFRDGACIVVELLKGQTLVEAKRLCLRDDNISVLTNSRVNWRLERGETVITVIEGSVDVVSPKSATIGQYDQWIVAGRMVARVSRLSPAAAEATADWSRRYFVPSQPARVWCCAGGRVLEVESADCVARGGRGFPDERSAAKACSVPPPASLVWCCAGGKVAEVDAKQCAGLQGRPFKDQPSARKACAAAPPAPPAPPPVAGWCCTSGGVVPADAKSCAKRAGRFFTDEREARKFCQPIG